MEDVVDEEEESAFLASDFSFCLASCLSAPSEADWAISRLRFEVP